MAEAALEGKSREELLKTLKEQREALEKLSLELKGSTEDISKLKEQVQRGNEFSVEVRQGIKYITDRVE